uniref:MCF.2 cell line derived transforming sequence a n=1 Tax=Cyprinus carpio TaxID=7962 RepID=A0A8C2CCI9_CYPCA
MWLIFIVSSEVTVPVSMQEVAGYIEKQVAYLSGGRGEDSSVIITLPECSAFSDIPEEALAKVLSYLTLIPRSVTRQPGVKFIIILDRRLDTWASFPGNLHLVLVLRPTSFFQRTVTDLGFRFSQEDFMLKMPVVMLSSVTDLLRYIDENQLTSEFGGTLDYCHSDWIVLRTAIESFAVMVKDIAQMLQAFGTELAETQLSEECSAVEFLLLSHTEKYRRLKVQLNEALMCRESSHFSLIDYWWTLITSVANMLIFLIDLCVFQDEMSQAQVLILHGHQLAAGHHYAMALIVQRCNELRHQCDTLTSALNTKRNSLTQAQTLLRLLEEAQRWCDDGAYLLANQQVDKFQSKEGAQAALRDIEKFQEAAPPLLCAGVDVLFLEYESVLTPCLQAHIEKTFQKHSSVQALIQSRQNCLRKLADKHVRPIQLVVPRPENPPRAKSPLFSPKHGMWWCNINFGSNYLIISIFQPRILTVLSIVTFSQDFALNFSYSVIHVMKELIETERIYVEELLAVLLGYRAEMDNPSLAPLLPTSLRNKRDVLFGNLPDIYNFHSSVFLQDLESCLESPEAVGACFLERKEHFHLYECYCQNKPRSDSLWRQFSDCPFFQECQKKLEHKLALDSYLLKPVQRLTKYQLLLKELLKYSSGCERASELQGALEAMLDLLKSVNDSMHQIAITGYEGDLSNLGRVLMQGSFSVWISHKKGPTRVKELARFKPMQRHLFLHEHALLFCKRREEHGENADKTPSYSFKHCLKMSAVGITENVKGDVKKFEIWYSGREEVYVIQAPTVEVKIAWLNEIRKILTNQQKQLKGLNTFPRSCVTLLQSQSRCRCLLLSQ